MYKIQSRMRDRYAQAMAVWMSVVKVPNPRKPGDDPRSVIMCAVRCRVIVAREQKREADGKARSRADVWGLAGNA